MYRLEVDMAGDDWDSELARLGGHPWQSAAWGEAQREADGVAAYRLRLSSDNETVQMVRVEARKVMGLGKLAWIRRGPTGPSPADRRLLRPEIVRWLSARGFVFAVANPWCRDPNPSPASSPPRTIWIDLTAGQDRLWKNLQSHWRNGVMKARRRGIVVERTRDPAVVARYFALCKRISEFKGFELRMTPALITSLLNAPYSAHTEAQLFIARHEDEMAAGALIYRCGSSIHYMGGASNRAFSKLHPGEALHWAVVEWGLSQGCARYDLEGIDPVGNPGTYDFKRKMGGEEVTLAGRQLTPLNLTGRVLAPAVRALLESRLSELPSLARLMSSRTAQEAS